MATNLNFRLFPVGTHAATPATKGSNTGRSTALLQDQEIGMSSAITSLRWVLPHFIFIYCFVLFFTTSHVLSAVVVGLLLALLVYFRIPAVDRDVANKMLQAEKVSIIAHRGAAKDAPENTIGAIRKVSSK